MIAPSDLNFDVVPTSTGRDSLSVGTIKALQLGMAWFPEQPGGLDRYYYDLLHHLPLIDVKVRGIVCGSPEVEQQSNGDVIAATGLTTRLPLRLLALRRSIDREMLDFKPDIFGAHFALYAAPALSKIKDKPFVAHFHGPWHKESVLEGYGKLNCWARYQMEKAVYRRADRLITLSNSFATELVRTFGIDQSRITVIPGGVNIRRFDVAESRAQARTQLGWPTDRPIVLTVRRLTKRMGLENVIQAAELIRDRCPDVLMLIAGSGKLQSHLQQQIESAGLQQHVRLLGFVPDADLPLAYRAADLSIVPSISLEGFGLVAAESLAAGTPVVATPVGGLPEIIRPLREELLTRGITAKHLADAVIPALLHLDRLPDSSECTLYAQRYDWSVVSSAVREVFASMM